MKKYYSIPQAAKICSVGRSTMHRWVTSGKIKSHGIPGGNKRILPEDLIEWLDDNQFPYNINDFKDADSKILIVDDDKSIRNYLKQILSGIFINIEFAEDGFEAGKKLIQFKPDLIILDLYMPNMDGFEVCQKIKEDSSTQNIKILILTGHGTKPNMDKALSIGADAFLKKPCSKKEIMVCVEKLLKSK